ncbi:hypothetical protein PCE1_001009 [Barthelona sp. PCE]
MSDTKTALMQLQRIPHNRRCFDCNASTTGWVSLTFGVFVCIKCAGRHRGLGAAKSFVQSIDLDDHPPKNVIIMRKGGNKKAQEFFEKNGLPAYGIQGYDTRSKYVCRAAQVYRDHLESVVEAFLNDGEAPEEPIVELISTESKTELEDFLNEESNTGAPKSSIIHPQPQRSTQRRRRKGLNSRKVGARSTNTLGVPTKSSSSNRSSHSAPPMNNRSRSVSPALSGNVLETNTGALTNSRRYSNSEAYNNNSESIMTRAQPVFSAVGKFFKGAKKTVTQGVSSGAQKLEDWLNS